MNNEQMNQIIDETYKNYLFNSEWLPIANTNRGFIGTKADSDEIMTQEIFINKCKTDSEFSEKWGLKIEERELSWEERRELISEDIARGRVLDRNGLNQGDFGDISPFTEKIIHYWMNQFNIPTKLITVTYKEQTIESYE